MRSFLAAACMVAGLAASSLSAQPAVEHVQKLNNIRKLIALTGGAKMIDQMFDSMAVNFKDPKAAAAFQEFRQEFDPSQLYELMVPAYDKYLTADDVKEILHFYESPTGHKMVEMQPKIMADSMPKIFEWSQQVSNRVMEKMKQKGIQ